MVRFTVCFLIGIVPSVHASAPARRAPWTHHARRAKFEAGVHRIAVVRVEVPAAHRPSAGLVAAGVGHVGPLLVVGALATELAIFGAAPSP